MRIDWAIPCTSAGLRNGLLTLEGGCLNRLELAELPSEVAIVLAIKVAGLREDFTEEADRRIEAHLLGPGMQLLESLEFDAPAFEPSPEHPDGWEVWRTVFAVVQFVPNSEGAHSIDFYAHGKYQAQKTIPLWIAVAAA